MDGQNGRQDKLLVSGIDYVPQWLAKDRVGFLYLTVFSLIAAELAEKFGKQKPRWPMGYNGSNQEHIVKYMIDPSIIPDTYPELKDYFTVNQISDADSLQQMLLTQVIGQVLLHEINQSQNSEHPYFAPDEIPDGISLEYIYTILNLVNLTHDLQEAEVGDEVNKDLNFKITEHLIFKHEIKYVLEQIWYKLRLKNYEDVFADIFNTLFAEEKLTTKYLATIEDLKYDFSPIELAAREHKFYKKLNEFYETTHLITFFMAALSNNSQEIADLALKYDVIQSQLPHILKLCSEYRFVKDLVDINKPRIQEILELGKKPQIEFCLIDHNRKFVPYNDLLQQLNDIGWTS